VKPLKKSQDLSCFPVNSVDQLDKATLKGEDISYSIFNPVGQLDGSALKVENINTGSPQIQLVFVAFIKRRPF